MTQLTMNLIPKKMISTQLMVEQPVRRLVVRAGREEGGLVTGLCAESCLPQPLPLLSVSLHEVGGEGEVSLATQAGPLVSGYREQHIKCKVCNLVGRYTLDVH